MKFIEAARRACATSMDHLSETTQQDLVAMLREHGRIGSFFGDVELETISLDLIRAWSEGLSGEIKPTSVDKHLYAMGFVFSWAIENEEIKDNPVASYRRIFRKRYSKSIRQSRDPSRNIRPLRPEAQSELLRVAHTHYSDQVTSLILLQLDAGLRVGEAVALRWEHVENRALYITENMPRHIQEPVAPKSGHARRVEMSQRLRDWLLPMRGLDMERVVNPLNYWNFRRSGWGKLVSRAGLSDVRFKDLRDTYACTLLSSGIPIAYIAKQLGHSNVNVTAKHYAQWLYEGWRPPILLEFGQVPADLLDITEEQASGYSE